jgi:phosphate transport system permease protein
LRALKNRKELEIMALYGNRKRKNLITMLLCYSAALLGISILVIILATLLFMGLKGINLDVFTKITPPPGATDGGLLNAIVGSLLMTTLGVFIGTPIGIMAGTYLAEYGRYSKISQVIRFLNDILLSAPSIVIGLFTYELMVAPWGHFSGLAGAVSLSILVIPVVVRTTENMLLLVPNPLREAASAMGMPRSHVIRNVAYRAAKAGMLTGVLLAIARVSGETAPLIFTAFNSPYMNLDMSTPMASLPAVIYSFAGSPYKEWQQLAWTAALIITFTVLALSVSARALSSKGK